MLADLECTAYRNVFIVESRNFWESCRYEFDYTQDIVLTFDFGLKKEIELQGGVALFLDHFLESEAMQQNNFLIYRFFERWNLDEKGEDLFIYKGVPFGFSFRVDIWNDFTFYLRIRFCLEEMLKFIGFEQVFAGTDQGVAEEVLNELSIAFKPIAKCDSVNESYYFPIFRYMHENTRSFHWKSKLKDYFMLLQGSVMPWWDKLIGADKKKPLVFIQEYHPTREILAKLRDSGHVRVLVERISSTSGIARYFIERPIPLRKKAEYFQEPADEMMAYFIKRRCTKLLLANGSDVSPSVYALIEMKLRKELSNQIRILDAVINYVNANPVSLEVLIGNIGRFPTLLDCVLKQKKVPSYLIINGLLGPEYSDESKYATVINGYSESIKKYYFKNQENVLCLGDVRMDAYTPVRARKAPAKEISTITIGASGFNPVDLNSYVAVEFDFLFDVLQAIAHVRKQGFKAKVIVKVRPNGYLLQYQRFVQEYFSDSVDSIIDAKPMMDVLKETDFYISIYSQTLFEASCLGVPVVYYKKDNEVLVPPFDGCSELVTVGSVGALTAVIEEFYGGSDRFDAFLEQQVMEKYIGYLDGNNLNRNLNQIEKMLS